MNTYSLSLLGNVELAASGIPLNDRLSTKARCLIAYIAINPSPIIPRNRAATAIWSHSDEARAMGSLRQCIKQISSAAEGLLNRSERGFISLNTRNILCDLWRLREIMNSNDTQALQNFGWDGKFVDDLNDVDPAFDEFLYFERASLTDRFTGILEDVLRGENDVVSANPQETSSAERLNEIRKSADAIAAVDPINEFVVQQQMIVASQEGNTSKSILLYNRLKNALRRTLDADPSAETKELFRSIRAKPHERRFGDSNELTSVGQHRPSNIAGFAERQHRGGFSSWNSEPPDFQEYQLPFFQRTGHAADLGRELIEFQDSGVSVLSIDGPAGVGKSRLAREALSHVFEAGSGIVVELGCSAHNSNTPYSTFSSFLHELYSCLLDKIDYAAGRGRDTVAVNEAPQTIRSLIDKIEGRLESEEINPQFLATEVGDILLSASIDQNFIILIDDVQNADKESISIFETACNITNEFAILFVTTSRERLKWSLRSEVEQKRYTIDPFEKAEVYKILEGERIPEELMFEIWKSTGGIAFYIEALCAAARRISILSNPISQNDELKALLRNVKSDVLFSVTESIDLENEVSLRVLYFSACLGGPSSYYTYERLVSCSPMELKSAIESLRRLGLLLYSEESETLVVSHDLVCEAVHRTMTPTERQSIHQEIFEYMSYTLTEGESATMELAAHARAAGQSVDAFSSYVSAAKGSMAKGAYESAYISLRSALEIANFRESSLPRERVANVHFLIATNFVPLGELRRAVDHFRKYIAYGNSHTHEFYSAQAALASLLSITGQINEAGKLLTSTLADSVISAHHEFPLRVQEVKASFLRGEFFEAIERAKRFNLFDFSLLPRDRVGEDVLPTVELMGTLSMCFAQIGDFKSARSIAFKNCQYSKEAGRSIDTAFSEFYRQYCLSHQGETTASIVNIRRALQECRAAEIRFAKPWLQGHLGLIYELRGNLDGSIELHEASLSEVQKMQIALFECYDLTALSRLYLKKGDIELARDYVDEALTKCALYGFRSVEVWALRNRGLIEYASTKKTKHALEFLESSKSQAEELSMKPDLAHILVHIAELEEQTSNNSRGHRLRAQAAEMYQLMNMRHWL